jgi:hypothetical protein
MRYLKVKNLDLYQHYGTRNPPWVKLYRVIMGDYDLRQVPIASRLCFIYCTILASETDNRIPFDCHFLSDRMGFKVTEEVITALIERGLLLASGARRLLATEEKCSSLLCLPLNSSSDSDLKSKNETKEFEQFWLAYPKKVGKKAARKAWEKAKDKPNMVDILHAIDRTKNSEQWTKEHGQFIPNPSTWLNEGRWADQPTQGNGSRNVPPFPPKTDPIARGQWRNAYGDPRQYGYAD